MSFFGGFNPGS